MNYIRMINLIDGFHQNEKSNGWIASKWKTGIIDGFYQNKKIQLIDFIRIKKYTIDGFQQNKRIYNWLIVSEWMIYQIDKFYPKEKSNWWF